MSNTKELNQALRRELALYNQSKQHAHLKEAQRILAQIGRQTKQKKAQAAKQQTNLF